MRRSNSEEWVESLIELTNQRPRSDDEIFYRARGPHSAMMEEWLRTHMANYDTVLIQGVPFSTSIMAARVAQQLGVGYTVLPHFHMEDRYYHWRDFYDIFRTSQTTIAFPRCSREYFFDVIDAPSTPIPGGGVDLGEFERSHLVAATAAFRALHSVPTPFILVLGRKAAGKNYRLAVEAVQKLRSAGHNLELLMIGPDDDKQEVRANGVTYYGPQPRSVVLGALQEAVCVVNMSDSESFGIVVLEAWLAGRPIVAQRNCLAFGELIEDGTDGFLAESVSDICDAVTRYHLDPSLASEHGAAGRLKALNYSWESIAKEFDDALVSSNPADSQMERLPD